MYTTVPRYSTYSTDVQMLDEIEITRQKHMIPELWKMCIVYCVLCIVHIEQYGTPIIRQHLTSCVISIFFQNASIRNKIRKLTMTHHIISITTIAQTN